jgi:hypothetical protein
MPSAGFEPANAATKRPQTYAFDRATTGIGIGKIFGSEKDAVVSLCCCAVDTLVT